MAGILCNSIPYHNTLFSAFTRGQGLGWRLLIKEDSWVSQSPEATSDFYNRRKSRKNLFWNNMSATLYWIYPNYNDNINCLCWLSMCHGPDVSLSTIQTLLHLMFTTLWSRYKYYFYVTSWKHSSPEKIGNMPQVTEIAIGGIFRMVFLKTEFRFFNSPTWYLQLKNKCSTVTHIRSKTMYGFTHLKL